MLPYINKNLKKIILKFKINKHIDNLCKQEYTKITVTEQMFEKYERVYK